MATKTGTPIVILIPAICPGVNGGGSPAIIIIIRITFLIYKAITKSIIK